MGTEQLEYAYAGDILKWDDNGDGTINVYGMATDPSVDLDGQSCDAAWLKSAMPDWFASAANVREQHGAVAAGVGKELTHADGDKWMLKSTIVDPGTVAKVKHGVLKGYSIGVRNGQVMRGKAAGAPNGKIVGGKIVEVSLVDRPCNPLAVINIAKAAPGGDELEPVAPMLVDVDPTVYGESAAVVPSDDDDDLDTGADGEPDGEQDSQAVGEPVDSELSLFDDAPAVIDDADELEKLYAADLLGDDVVISKGLLESLINGPKRAKKDGDGDGKVGESDGAKRRAAERERNRKHREQEAERERKHHAAMDAEAAQDANNAQRQGRRQEADEHRGRLGSYRKALELHDYRAGVKLVKLVRDGVIVKSAELDDDGEVIAELADLVVMEADQIARNGYSEAEDISLLLDACAAIAKMAGVEPTITKGAGSVLDGSSAQSATVDVAEIVKAQVAEQLSIVQEAHEAELATLRAQVTKMAATPLPGGPVMGAFVLPSTPAQSVNVTKALDLERKAANPALAPDVAAGYLELAAAERAKG